MSGSSPRVWGTRVFYFLPSRVLRFIPTRVGNTRLPPMTVLQHTVHPHACGEHTRTSQNRAVQRGSSPRVWGTLCFSISNRVCPRFIPTRVGNTQRQHKILFGAPVHPHACGEHRAFLLRQSTQRGSSPRVWGTHMTAFDITDGERFIPTRVGNTWTPAFLPVRGTVHPHACGEHMF